MVASYISHLDYLRSPSGLETASLIGNSLYLAKATSASATTLSVTTGLTIQLNQYDRLTIFDGASSEVVTVSAPAIVGATSITISSGLQYAHAAGTPMCSDGPLGSLADQLIRASSQWENEFTYQSLFQQTYTGEILPMPTVQAHIDNQSMLVFRPKHFPVTAVSAISLNAIQAAPWTLDPGQAFIDANQQIVRVPVINATAPTSQVFWPQMPLDRVMQQWLTISYTAGYAAASMPPDVVEGVTLLVSAILSRRQNPTGADQITLGKKSMTTVIRGDTRAESVLKKDAHRLASRYKVRAI